VPPFFLLAIDLESLASSPVVWKVVLSDRTFVCFCNRPSAAAAEPPEWVTDFCRYQVSRYYLLSDLLTKYDTG
jgi:hypothetical protein